MDWYNAVKVKNSLADESRDPPGPSQSLIK